MEWILFGMITTLIVVGLYFARTTQDYINEENERYKMEKEKRINYRALDKLEKRIATLEKK